MNSSVWTICAALISVGVCAGATQLVAQGGNLALCAAAQNEAASVCAPSGEEEFELASLLGVQSPWLIGGWTNFAYYTNNIPLSFTDDDLGSFDDLPGRVNLAQQWLYLERTTDGSTGPALGGRVDLIYGTDAQKSQSYGNPGADVRGFGRFDASLDHGIYGWAIPQLYGALAIDDLAVKVGHFYTPLGYEKTQAISTFFHSHSFTSFDSEPFTHTGVLSTYTGLEKFTLYAGWTAGWDTGFDSFDGGSNWVGGFEVKPADDLTFAYLNTWGNFGWRDQGGSGSYSHSCVLKAQLTDKLEYVAQSDLLDTDNGQVSQYDTVGLVQYLFYKPNDTFGYGGRAEWWKADGVSYYEVTAGMNYHMLQNLVFRPEIRRDWIPALEFSQDVFAIDAVLQY